MSDLRAQSVEADTLPYRGGEPGSSPGARSDEPTRSALLVWVRGENRAVLYVYGRDGSYSQMFGTVDELREIARTRYADAELHETPLDGLFEVRDESGKQERRNFKGCEEADPPGIEQARSPGAFA